MTNQPLAETPPSTEVIRDKNGRELVPGDLTRTFHFRAANRRHGIQYLYHTAVSGDDGHLWLIPTCELNPKHRDSGLGGRCRARSLSQRFEIIDGYGLPGTHNWFRERPKCLGLSEGGA